MKKHLSFFSIIVLFICSYHASAQGLLPTAKGNPTTRYSPQPHGRDVVGDILRKQEARAEAADRKTARTSAVLKERLVACSEYDYNLADSFEYYPGKRDSCFFIYHSNQRGSVFDKNSMGYYDGRIFGQTSYTNPVWSGFRYYNDHTLPNDIKCDTQYSWTPCLAPDSTGHIPYNFFDIHVNEYDANNNAVVYHDNFYPTVPGQIQQKLCSFNSNGDINAYVTCIWSGTAWDTIDIFCSFYDSGGHVLLDSESVYSSTGWEPYEKWVYHYNDSGDLYFRDDIWDSSNTGVWTEIQRRYMTYYPDHRLATDSFSNPYLGVWYNMGVDSFWYTPGISYYTSASNSIIVSSDSFYHSVVQKHITTSGLPDTLYIIEYRSTSHAPSFLYRKWKTTYTYDSYDNPTFCASYKFVIVDSAAGTGYYDPSPIVTQFYYYETYMSTTTIPDAPATPEKILIYPNPATSQVIISRPDAVKRSYTFIRLTNELGQAVRTESMPWMNTTETISLAGIATGMYMLSVEDRNGNILSVQKIIKQ